MAPSPISIKLRCTSWKQLAALYERDLTRNAVFLKSSAPPPLGTSVRINLTLPTQVLIIMRGVVHEHVGPGGLNGRGPGVDIQLQEVPEDAMATIEAALTSAKRDIAASPSPQDSDDTPPRGSSRLDGPSPSAGYPANGAASAPPGDVASHEDQAPPEQPSAAPASLPVDDDLVGKLRQELESLRKLNPFQILGVGYETTDEAVNRAFASLSKRYHPDRFAGDENGEAREIATAIFSLIRHAYRGLNSTEARAISLEELEEKRAQANGSALAPTGEEDDAAAAPEDTPAAPDDEGISLFDSIMTDDDSAETEPQSSDDDGFPVEAPVASPRGLMDLESHDPRSVAPSGEAPGLVDEGGLTAAPPAGLGDGFDDAFGDGFGDGFSPEPGAEPADAPVNGYEDAAPYPPSDDGSPIDIEIEDPDGPVLHDQEPASDIGLADEDVLAAGSVPVPSSDSDSSAVQLAIDDPTPIPPPSPIGESDEERDDGISDDMIDAIPLDDDGAIELLDDDDALTEPEPIEEAVAESRPRSGPPPLPVPGARPAPPPIPGAKRPPQVVVAPEPMAEEIEPTPIPVAVAPEPEPEPAPEISVPPEPPAESPASALADLQIDDGSDDALDDGLDEAFADPAEPPGTYAGEASAADSSMEEPIEEEPVEEEPIEEEPPADEVPSWLGMAAEPRFAEAFDLIRDRKYREALTVYKVALRRDPGDKGARVGIELTEGLKALEERDRMEAAQRFELVLELDPGNQRAAQAIAEMREQAAAERKEHLEKLRNQQD